ncbi:hypothetical protein GN956_G11254 [Arapaima gigas]
MRDVLTDGATAGSGGAGTLEALTDRPVRQSICPLVLLRRRHCFCLSRMESAPAASSGAEDGEPQTTLIGTTKPLHRFIRGEPKSIGVVMLFLGLSQFLIGIPMKLDISENSTNSYCEFWLGILFISSGILFILSENNPSKKLVTASMAVGIVSIIGAVLAFFEFLVSTLKTQHFHIFYPDYDIDYYNLTNEDEPWRTYHVHQVEVVEAVLLFYCIAAIILLITMTAFAKAGLRSSKTQLQTLKCCIAAYLSRMESVPVSGSGADDETQTAVIATSKPLHRFIRGEPKSIGIVMLFLGGSQFLVGIPMKLDITESSAHYYTAFWLGIMFIISGILYILSDQNVSKKMVTASLGVTIISIIGSVVAFFFFLAAIFRSSDFDAHYYYVLDYYNSTAEDYTWRLYHVTQILCLESLLLIYCIVGGFILITMSAFARAGLRSSRTQAIVIMHNRRT